MRFDCLRAVLGKRKIFFYDAVSFGMSTVQGVSVDHNVFIFIVKRPKKK
jgi:hypothetical protein